jgi:hypothetical protein
MQGVDILGQQNELGEGEFLREWILFRDIIETVDKSVDFNAFLLQGVKEGMALCLLIKRNTYGSQLQVVLLQIRTKRTNAGGLFSAMHARRQMHEHR